MSRIVGGILVLVLGLSVAAAEDARQGTQPAAPEQQYQALRKEYNNAFEEYATAFREAKLPEDRQKAIQEKYPQPGKWAAKFPGVGRKEPQRTVRRGGPDLDRDQRCPAEALFALA